MVAQIDIPNNVERYYNDINKIHENAIVALLYYKDFADGKKTLGNIADDLKITKRSLIDIYENARMPIITYGVNDLREDIENLEAVF